MLKCEICQKEIENNLLLQKHFGFKNAEEKLHKEYKQKQEIIAVELFHIDRTGDTFHILNTHPEINLISEKRLREIWKEKYGKEAIEKRRVEIGNKKRNETIYEPARKIRNIGKDKKCPVCDFLYESEITLNHHMSSKTDDIHKAFFELQRKIAENIFEKDKENNLEELKKLYQEFILSDTVMRTFWVEKYGQEEVTKRRYFVSSNSRTGMIGWKIGLTKETDIRVNNSSIVLKELNKNGIAHLLGDVVSKNLINGYKNGTRTPPTLNPKTAKKIGDTMRQQYVDGTRKTPHGKGGYREDINMYVRSTWEYNFVKILQRLNIPFEYEPKTFPLLDESGSLVDSYTPDFRLKDKWYEIKGVFNSAKDWSNVPLQFQQNITKINLFKQQYPNEKLVIIGKKEYKRIIKKFNLPYRYPRDFFVKSL